MNSVPEPGHSFAPKSQFSAATKCTYRQDLTEIKSTIISSTFETIDWANKRENENFVSVAL